MKYLLDVNMLIAAVWTDHVHHSRVNAWLENKDLATCPFSELGFLRVSTHPKPFGADMSTARFLLKDLIRKRSMAFIPADVPALKSKASQNAGLTDLYLAELADSHGCKLASLDTGITHRAVEMI